jgi:hypothetical protein
MVEWILFIALVLGAVASWLWVIYLHLKGRRRRTWREFA